MNIGTVLYYNIAIVTQYYHTVYSTFTMFIVTMWLCIPATPVFTDIVHPLLQCSHSDDVAVYTPYPSVHSDDVTVYTSTPVFT